MKKVNPENIFYDSRIISNFLDSLTRYRGWRSVHIIHTERVIMVKKRSSRLDRLTFLLWAFVRGGFFV